MDVDPKFVPSVVIDGSGVTDASVLLVSESNEMFMSPEDLNNEEVGLVTFPPTRFKEVSAEGSVSSFDTGAKTAGVISNSLSFAFSLLAAIQARTAEGVTMNHRSNVTTRILVRGRRITDS